MSKARCLDSMNEDILILIFSRLGVPDLLSVRQACQRLNKITRLRFVWYNACVFNILRPGYPFPDVPLDDLTEFDLERYTRLAHRLSLRWSSRSSLGSQHRAQSPAAFDSFPLTRERSFKASTSTEITAVRFLHGRKERYLLAVSKGIWSTLSLWRIDGPGGNKSQNAAAPHECTKWSPKGALFSKFVLNKDVKSEGVIALSVFMAGFTIVLTLEGIETAGSDVEFKVLSTIDTTLEPMEMRGNIIAFADESSQTVIFNRRTGLSGLLQHEQEQGVFLHDPCVQVVFAYHSVLVVRARSLHLFPWPELLAPDVIQPTRSVGHHSFGWVDGISAVLPAQKFNEHSDNTLGNKPIMILSRTPSHDPWSSDVCTLDLYKLEPNPAFVPPTTNDAAPGLWNAAPGATSPYIFPPLRTAQADSRRGPIRCLDIMLGKYGTAMWLHPRDSATHGLVSLNTHLQEIPLQSTPWSDERLVAAVLSGPLDRVAQDDMVTTIARNVDNDWTALDYDEGMGRVAIGSSFGKLTIMEL
ncbi:hypothetical protein BDN71DRAFT_1393458 [Pleurotus eryngii]|uniref:F-box domain-containing protein n=1 Tax=Pleurotus eryngii TaxID=5323 RepID=A0A9P5ZVL3_PLEER|nr:hypothetical protein BDN71DRAFT_1393458 [Pleurotus eryngii]